MRRRHNSPATTSPATTSPILSIDPPAGSSGVTRVVATRSQVDAMAVTRQAVWLAVGGLVLRVDPATGRALTVPGAEAVVDLEAGAGAVWAVTSGARLLGLGGPQVRGPRRNLFHVDRSVLR